MSKTPKNAAVLAAAVAATLATLPTNVIAQATPAPTAAEASNNCCHTAKPKNASGAHASTKASAKPSASTNQ